MAFFPQMLAGPIERARRLVPQLENLPNRLHTGQALEGAELIVIGLFKKVAVADVMLRVVLDAYAPFDIAEANGWTTYALALPAFGIQIYCDFSGYSDMARGIGKLFGIELSRNFLRPKNSRTVLEFWQRWHITFTRFVRDYMLRPLGGFHGSRAVLFRNALIIFAVSGLWHGARWPLVAWGLALGVAVGGALLYADWHRGRRREAEAGGARPDEAAGSEGAVATLTRPLRAGPIADVRKRIQVLTLLVLTTPLFVAPTFGLAWDVYAGIFTLQPGPVEWHHFVTVLYGVAMLVMIDNHQQTFEADEERRARDRRRGRPGAEDISLLSSWDWQIRTAFLVLGIVVFGANIQAAEFYYFQF